MNMYKCKYCGQEFDTKQKLGGHTTSCKKNPNYSKCIKNLELARNQKGSKDNEIFICKYCGKEIGNAGCLKLHEKACKSNPENFHKIRIKKKRVLTDEHKDKIRKSLALWKELHYDEFIEYSKGKSKCCENFKTYLRSNDIEFVEEYCPYPDERLYSLDIAWPDEKIAIEINGSQHYDDEGNLNSTSLEKQKFFEDRGWKIIQIYYKWCYGVISDNKQINSIFDLPIHSKSYVKEIYKRSYRAKLAKEKRIRESSERKKDHRNKIRDIFIFSVKNSQIDFSKFGWTVQLQKYIKSEYDLEINNIRKTIKLYYPEFFDLYNVYNRQNN